MNRSIFSYWCELLCSEHASDTILFMQNIGVNKEQFPEIHVLKSCEQDPGWHPEGDVFIHTMKVLDIAQEFRIGDSWHDRQLMFGALCHDFGKATTTKFERGRWRSLGHETAGVPPTRQFLSRIGAPAQLIEAVVVLVKNHLAPVSFMQTKSPAGPKAYRKLATRLEIADTSMEMLVKIARADSWGRDTEDAKNRMFDKGEKFLKKWYRIAAKHAPTQKHVKAVVNGKHLIARGHSPGQEFVSLIALCKRLQTDHDLSDPDEIMDKAGIENYTGVYNV